MKRSFAVGLFSVLAPACTWSQPEPHAARTSVTAAEEPVAATPGEPFELRPDVQKLTLAFTGGAPLCANRTTREASGKYVVDFARKTVRLSANDACGGALRQGAILTPAARARIEELIEATKVPKETASFGAQGEIAQARCTMTITRSDGKVARYGGATPDPHEGHAPRMRAYLDSLLQ
jgi:hypothetical protein